MASVLDSFSEGFRLTSRHFGFLVLPAFLFVLVQFGVWALEFLDEASLIGSFELIAAFVLVGFIGAAVNVWIFSRALTLVTEKEHLFRWSAAFALYGYLFIAVLIAQTVSFIIGMGLAFSSASIGAILGVMLLWQAILVFFYVRFIWFVPEIASDDREKGAFARSWQLTHGHFWQVVGFSFLSSFILFAGFIALGVGVLFAIPMIVVSSVHYYEQLRKEAVA